MERKQTKLICVMRRDLRDKHGHKVQKGKLMAQAGHAYVGAVLQMQSRPSPANDEVLQEWLKGSFVKIGLGVDSETELMEVYAKALSKGLNVVLIKDEGRTVFDKPTYTCLGIGPHFNYRVDEVTAKLKGY